MDGIKSRNEIEGLRLCRSVEVGEVTRYEFYILDVLFACLFTREFGCFFRQVVSSETTVGIQNG